MRRNVANISCQYMTNIRLSASELLVQCVQFHYPLCDARLVIRQWIPLQTVVSMHFPPALVLLFFISFLMAIGSPSLECVGRRLDLQWNHDLLCCTKLPSHAESKFMCAWGETISLGDLLVEGRYYQKWGTLFQTWGT